MSIDDIHMSSNIIDQNKKCFLNTDEDNDIIRIKHGIQTLNNMFKQGTISILLKTMFSYMVTLEISNGQEKITIQEILKIIKDRIDKLNIIFDELCYTINQYNPDNDDTITLIEKSKKDFRVQVYKIFDLTELLHLFVNKCLSLGFGKSIFYTLDKYIHPYTMLLIDGILFTQTQPEFENLIYGYINERCNTIKDPAERKLTKIKILHNILSVVINEPLDEKKSIFDTFSEIHIEMSEKTKDKGN